MPPADFSSTVWIFTKTRSPKGFSVVNFGATEVAAFIARHLREFEAGKNACIEPDCSTEPFVAALRPWNEAIFKCELTADPNWAAVAIAAISSTKWTPQLTQESKKGIRNARQGKHRKQQSRGEAKCVAKKERHTELAILKELGFKNFATSGDFVEASRELANCVAVWLSPVCG